MDADGRAAILPEMLLALCALPKGVKARDEALDADLVLLRDIAGAVRDALESEASLDQETDARVFLAVHLVAQVAVSLIDGIRQMLPHNSYAANALVRQLVEVEYLAWACGHDSAEAVDWLVSDRETRLKRWSPQRLRNRAAGRFDDEDYWNHCEMGGHPTAVGITSLHGPTEANPELALMPEVTLYEVTLHATAITDYLSHAIPPQLTIAVDAVHRAHLTNVAWRKQDPAARWKKHLSDDPVTQARLLLDVVSELDESADREYPSGSDES